jgi:cytosine/adenosine deaminase-related metal-dependent hydrolase
MTRTFVGTDEGARVTRTFVGTVVTGDGRTVHEPGYVVVERGVIAAVGSGRRPGAEDLGAAIVAPGLVNLHAHGLTLGPIHATGSPSLTREEVTAFKDRHLRGGTTTAMSVDGFPLWDESQALAATHPLTVVKCTAHSPANVRAAELADGKGLSDAHRRATMADLLAQGARCIGEIGAGGTLGGGMQDYAYIPAAVQERSGVTVTSAHARALKEAVLGRTIDPANLDRDALHAAMAAAGLGGVLSEDDVIETITACVMPSMAQAYEGMREAARASAATGAPFIVHHAAASAEVVLEVASERLIAGHCNHPSFLPDEAIHYARELRRRGATLELSGLDLFSKSPDLPDAAPFRALVRAGLVDVVGTDYAGSKFDPVSVPLFALYREGLLGLAETLALATGNVARRFPELTDAGLLEPGRPADLAVFTPAFDRVLTVVKGGASVAEAR